MGIGREAIELMILLRTSGYLRRHTAVMEIGAQQLANDFLAARARIARLGHLFGIDRPLSLPPPKATHIVHGVTEHLGSSAPFARDFWLWLGFNYAAIDIDGSPGSIPLDLNYDRVPPESVGKYDLVTNYGTTEHVANQLNAFQVIHDLTAPGGIMVHIVPAQGMLNHGLVNYNLKFFWMLGRSNGYKFIHAIFNQSGEFYGLPDYVVDFLDTHNLTGAKTKKAAKFQVADAGIQVVMEKAYDIPFVPPIDVATGTHTEIDALRKRYWTVFDVGPFDRLAAGGAGPFSHDLNTTLGRPRRPRIRPSGEESIAPERTAG